MGTSFLGVRSPALQVLRSNNGTIEEDAAEVLGWFCTQHSRHWPQHFELTDDGSGVTIATQEVIFKIYSCAAEDYLCVSA